MDKEVKLRIPVDLYARLTGYADAAGISKNQVMKDILEFHLRSDDYALAAQEYNNMLQDLSIILQENTRVMAETTALLLEMREKNERRK